MSRKCYSITVKLRAIAVAEAQSTCFLAWRVAV